MKRKIAIVLAFVMIFTTSCIGIAYGANKTPDIYRLGGNNRYETAIEIAKDGWDNAPCVVLANGNDFADALAGVPLASALDAPILVTSPNKISGDVLKTIKELKAKKIYILGGTGAISTAAEKQLKGYEIVRLAGATRFETSVRIAEEIENITGIESKDIFVAYAYNYPDALSISSVAGCMKAPIIYAPKTGKIDAATEKYIRSAFNDREKAIILGGPAIINNSVANSIKKAGVDTVTRLYGSNRYETCVKIYEKYKSMFDFSSITVATGEAFPDALSGGVYAAKKCMPLILVNNQRKQSALTDFISEVSPDTVYALGGQGAVSDRAIYNLYKSSGNTEDKDEKIRIHCKNNLPEEFRKYSSYFGTENRLLIKELKYGKGDYSNSVKITVFAEKTYDRDSHGSSRCTVSVRLTDESGFLVMSDVLVGPLAYVGDSFILEDIHLFDLEPGDYFLEFSDSTFPYGRL